MRQSESRAGRPLSVSEAARYAQVMDQEVLKAMKEGRLMWKRVGHIRSTTRPWLEEWLNA